MPELPETETMARDLDRAVAGRRITGVQVIRKDVLRNADTRTLTKRVTGASIARVWRRAKHVIVELSTTDRIAVQPRFTGGLLIDAGTLSDDDRRYSTVQWRLDDGRVVHYRDVRRLGTVTLMDAASFERFVARLGVEPLEPEFTDGRLWELVRNSRQAIKKVLMDQRIVAGVGNIYANEALWRAGIDPSRAARRVSRAEAGALRDAVVAVLSEAVAQRGTSFRDYRDASGARGAFVQRLAVYGREHQPCLRCGRRLVGTHAIDGRATVLCVRCQR